MRIGRGIIVKNGQIPTRPLLRWHGGKWRLAPWVISHFPAHRVYVEPFGGAGSVLFRKPRAYAEIYNDMDDWVVSLFRVLRDDAKAMRLVAALRMTPFSRIEFDEAADLAAADCDDVELARRLIIRAFMGFGSSAQNGRATGFRANSNRSNTTPAHDWANYPDAMPALIERLRGVVIEHRDAIAVMAAHDGEATLHYADPPYLPETRSPSGKHNLKMYRHEMLPADHKRLLAFLRTVEGMVVLSGYPSAMYDAELSDWRRVTCAALADGARARTEVLWLNPACATALESARAIVRAAADDCKLPLFRNAVNS